MDKLMALRMFVATVSGGGFTAAGRSLGTATSTVTRMIGALEADLGTALLYRSTRRITLTESGRQYLERAKAILGAVEAADLAVADRQGPPRGALRVSLPVAFGRAVVLPHVPALLAAHPGLQLCLALADEPPDLLAERVDLCICLGNRAPTDGVVMKPLGRFSCRLVASPEYLARHAPVLIPAHLQRHACLTLEQTGGLQWHLAGPQGSELVRVDGPLRSNDPVVLHEAALRGAGIALLPGWMVEADLTQGRLRPVLPAYSAGAGQGQGTVHALFLPNQRASVRVRTFIGLIERALGQPAPAALAAQAAC
ncbi:LysR substrate-binding domain-containing protein [Pseudomonas sp. NPDC007930]|uniref:LysR family transcriptional regulator n=1 Tax=Pseudomonas sp. NPDC007930 TaxID=3364417 RepID=UPI0036E6A6CD